MSWFGNMLAKMGLVESEVVRTRDKKGRYIADDPTTAKNEDKKTSGRTGEALDIGVKT